MSWTTENDTIKPIAALPLQAAGAGSIMEPQTEPVEKYWLHGGATNGAKNEDTNGAKAASQNWTEFAVKLVSKPASF